MRRESPTRHWHAIGDMMLEAEELLPSDKSEVERLHKEMGFDYVMPDLDSPLFVIKRVLRDEQGRILGAAGLRLQAETYLWLDSKAPVAVRYKVVAALSFSVFQAAWRVGIDCLVAWLPPGLPDSFKRLLTRFGWSADRAGWQSWTKFIE